ncbi:MAG: VIT1/CCC1 transporter family protein [Bacteroidetes bacterium]|nr:VIT1/CCC1 transporter family protein [Bacteroidota bacterium]
MKNRLHQQLQIEIDTAFLYKKLGENTPDEKSAEIYRSMSAIEGIHAGKMLSKIQHTEKNAILPLPSAKARIQVRLASVFGWGMIASTLMGTEKMLARKVIEDKKIKGEEVNPSILNHFAILDNINKSSSGMKGGILAKLEGRHQSVGGNAMRAAVLGANDGLVTNLSLIMGVAGAAVGPKAIIVTGIAGLLAGAFSMALGEWLSVQSSRELNQRQVDIETEEMENSPDEEMLELALIYQSKGMEKEEAERMAKKVFENKESAIDTLVREELGLDTVELGGSAWEAAITSFILFAVGAIIPLLPFLVLAHFHPVIVSLGVSTLGLFFLGAIITFYTGKSTWYSGLRQVLFGLLAAGLVYGIGRLIGGMVH